MDVHKQLTDVRIFYLNAKSFPDGIPAAFDELDRLIGHRDQRTFYGVSYEEDGKIIYRAGATGVADTEGG